MIEGRKSKIKGATQPGGQDRPTVNDAAPHQQRSSTPLFGRPPRAARADAVGAAGCTASPNRDQHVDILKKMLSSKMIFERAIEQQQVYHPNRSPACPPVARPPVVQAFLRHAAARHARHARQRAARCCWARPCRPPCTPAMLVMPAIAAAAAREAGNHNAGSCRQAAMSTHHHPPAR